MSLHTTARGLPTDAAFTSGFWVCAGVAVLVVVASLALPSAHHRHEQAVAAGVADLPPEPAELHLPHQHHGRDGAPRPNDQHGTAVADKW